MSNRSSQAEADLILAELAGILEHYNDWNLPNATGNRYNDIIQRLETLLDESLVHLKLHQEDQVNEGRTQSAPLWMFSRAAFQSKGQPAPILPKSTNLQR
jgi:hypothetical protein